MFKTKDPQKRLKKLWDFILPSNDKNSDILNSNYDKINNELKEDKMETIPTMDDYVNYLVYYARKLDIKFTNLHLQKSLYYLIGLECKRQNRYVIDEEFEAWRYGPVLYSIWKKNHVYSTMNIPVSVTIDEKTIDDELKANICKVLDYFKNNIIWDIVEKTHNDPIWIDAFENETSNKINSKKFLNFFLQNDTIG